jgi:hypothetical protein
MCSSTVAIVAPQKQRHAADLWDSRFSWRRSAGAMTARESRPRLSLARGGAARVIGPSRASALGALLAELQAAERLRKIVAGLRVYQLTP